MKNTNRTKEKMSFARQITSDRVKFSCLCIAISIKSV